MSFTKVLVANRGEIAVRVLKTAQALGYATVAVYTTADASAPHVALADEAVWVGEGPVGSSYLDPKRILEAAAASGADAVHPGYGFLSENAAFAAACAEAGVTFVGPSAQSITLMGDKVQAKRRMIDAGVPTAPGYTGDTQTETTLLAEAEKLGVPFLVKAVAGGGGRGMRKVERLQDAAAAIASARGEAASAFGNGDVFLERLVTGARHVEIQVFGDTHGNVVHLGERECSAQRRHQKVVEEAPSVAVGPELRAKMGAAAVAAARAIDYVGAGTVEFLLDDDGAFYFLEMNTRLQVEHPVTELVTGYDLVQWQLDVAAGAPLPVTQEDISLTGHAIELRLYAEDPYAGFLPQMGQVVRFDPPAGEGVRVDAGIRSGSEVSAFYDAMLAKLITHGRTRAEALRRMRRAVEGTALLGLTTNLEFLRELLDDPLMVAGDIKTDTLDARFATPPQRPEVGERLWAVAALVHTLPREDGARAVADATSWRSSGVLASTLSLRCGDTEPRDVRVERPRPDLAVVTGVGEGAIALTLLSEDDGEFRIACEGVARTYVAARSGAVVHVSGEGQSRSFDEPDPVAEASAKGDGVLRSPLSGTVLKVFVEEGASVQEGQLLVTVEAMKMEHRIEAPMAGIARDVSASAGAQVPGGAQLLKIEPPGGGEPPKN